MKTKSSSQSSLDPRNETRSRGRLLAALAFALLGAKVACAQTDDFNDGNDAGWSRYDPLAAFGAPARFTFPNGGYRLEAPASPNPELVGPARAGSLRSGVNYTRFQAAVDIVNWNQSIRQAFGLAGRLTTPGLGTTSGYTFNYNPVSGFLQINLVQNETPVRALHELPNPLNPEHDYRMVFTGGANFLLGQIFSLTNLSLPLISVYALDETTHPQGIAGVFVFSLEGNGTADATFDNYAASVPGTVRATVARMVPSPNAMPELPTDVVSVELVNLDTTIDVNSIQLRVDGQLVAPDVNVDQPGVIRLTYFPAEPLAVGSHMAKVTYSDEMGSRETEWRFGPPSGNEIEVESSGSVTGPFTPETGVVTNSQNKTLEVERIGAPKFYRLKYTGAIGPSTVVRITRIQEQASRIVLGYEVTQ
ncbi:MAG: hypothetical protein AB1813_07475 [Verrucomicrobiota bacterium]